jgi:hypothetical protein
LPPGIPDCGRDKDANHGRLLDQEEEVELLGACLNGFPRGKYSQRSKEADQHHQPHRDTVDAEVVMNVRAGDPGMVLLKLEAGLPILEVRRQMQCKREGQKGDQQRKPLDQLSASWKQSNNDSACRRHEGCKRQNGIVQHEYVPN